MCQAAPVFPVPKLPVPEQGSALSVPIRKTPDFCQAHSASHVTWLGFCSLRFTSLRIPIPLPRAILHDLRRMCQAAPVFPVPKLPVPEQGSALSVPIRKTPDFCQVYSAFHVNWLGFCSLRFTSLRIPIPLLRAVFATFRYVCTSVAGLGFCSLRFTSLRIPIPLLRAVFATFRYACTSVAGLGFCSLRFTSLRIPIPLPRAIFATFRYVCTSVAGLGFCSLRFTSLRIPIPLPRAVLQHLRRKCQAAPVFPVPKLPVPEQGSARLCQSRYEKRLTSVRHILLLM